LRAREDGCGPRGPPALPLGTTDVQADHPREDQKRFEVKL